jgi:dienelactone hydrolase
MGTSEQLQPGQVSSIVYAWGTRVSRPEAKMEAMSRREFVQSGAAVAAVSAARGDLFSVVYQAQRGESFPAYQERRRKQLWGLLGDLPWQHRAAAPRMVKTEKHEGYTLERLELDLNGIEPVPALLLIPDKRLSPAPGLLYIHWHGGMYGLGKEQLLRGVDVESAYAPVCVQKGLVTLAIDSWCFGERKHEADGKKGEEDAFKLMLWKGQVLFGMMMFDELRAIDYLARRPEVDPRRIGTLGMSMGATKAWWLAALDPRVRLCLDVCCLTDYEELIKAGSLGEHGIYYYVPSLLKHFQTAEINELIVPRPRLSVNGRKDALTPPAGVAKIRDHLLPLYRQYGREQDCRIELFDAAHEELPEMRKLILEWMDRHLVEKETRGKSKS